MALNDPMTGGGPAHDERDSRLTQLYHAASDEEPPVHLDAAILAAVRREAGTRPRPITSQLRAWRVPVSIAAVVMLSASIITLMREEGGDRITEAPPAVPPVAQPTATPSAADMKPGGSPAGQRAAEAPETAATPPAALGSAPRATAPLTGATVSKEATATTAARARAAEPFSGAVQEQRQTDDVGRRPAPPQPELGPASAARAVREDAPAASPRVLSAPPSPPAAASAEAGLGGSEARALRSERPPAAAPQKAALLRELEHQPPERWLEKIEELRRQGQAPAAEDMLAEFKRRFPGHPLPPGLR